MKRVGFVVLIIFFGILIKVYFFTNTEAEKQIVSDRYVDGGLRIFASLAPDPLPVIKYVRIKNKKIFGYKMDQSGIIISVNKSIYPNVNVGDIAPSD